MTKKTTTKDLKAVWKQIDRERQPIVKAYKKWLLKHLGKRCKDFSAGCIVCHAWQGYDILQGL